MNPPSDRLSILAVEDDPVTRSMMRMMLERDGFAVTEAATGNEAVARFREIHPDLIMMDIAMPDLDGVEACRLIRREDERIPILLVTSLDEATVVERAFAAGATDFISKPLQWSIFLQRARHLARAGRAERRVETLETIRHYQESHDTEEFVGDGPATRRVREFIDRAAGTDAPVLVTGETGTGKNVVARAIHRAGPNRVKPFLSVNCAAIPEALIEAELFGVEKGAFTGATATRKGVFELADGGTLFLDEIGEMPFGLQAKLLAAIEDRTVKRLGGETSRRVAVRIVAATNADPTTAIRERRLRNDLFYRLSVLTFRMPPLRERRDEIPGLCRFFAAKFSPNHPIALPESEIAALQAYDWPGNVRELRNIMERSVILRREDVLYPSRLLGTIVSVPETVPDAGEFLPLADIERRYVVGVFEAMGRNLTRTAKVLDIAVTTLKRKLKAYHTAG